MSYYCGFLVTSKPLCYNDIWYNGIECDAWPLELELLKKALTPEQVNLIDNKIDDMSVKNEIALLDIESAKMYVMACNVYNQEYCVKYVEVIRNDAVNNSKSAPFFESFTNFKFLGYDVGVCAYDYYSSVLSDIIARPFLFGSDTLKKLNSNGLFHNYSDAKQFILQRNSAVKTDNGLYFENCSVDIIKIHVVSL